MQYECKTYPFSINNNTFDGHLERQLVSGELPRDASLTSIGLLMYSLLHTKIQKQFI